MVLAENPELDIAEGRVRGAPHFGALSLSVIGNPGLPPGEMFTGYR